MDGRRSQVAHRSIHWLRSPIKLFIQPVLLRVSYTHTYWGAPVVCRPRRLLCRPRESRHTQYPRHLRYTLPLSPHTQWYLLPVSRLRYYSWPWGLCERVKTSHIQSYFSTSESQRNSVQWYFMHRTYSSPPPLTRPFNSPLLDPSFFLLLLSPPPLLSLPSPLSLSLSPTLRSLFLTPPTHQGSKHRHPQKVHSCGSQVHSLYTGGDLVLFHHNPHCPGR